MPPLFAAPRSHSDQLALPPTRPHPARGPNLRPPPAGPTYARTPGRVREQAPHSPCMATMLLTIATYKRARSRKGEDDTGGGRR